VRTAILTIAVLLALPAAAWADDPLLSGYGGPGAGEQAVVSGGLEAGGGSGASGVGYQASGAGGGGAQAGGQSSASQSAGGQSPSGGSSSASGNLHSPDTQPNVQGSTSNANVPRP
jgi:hypothetical protein